MERQERSSHASSQASLGDLSQQFQYSYDPSWIDTKVLPECSQDLLPDIQLPPISSYNQGMSYHSSKQPYHGVDNNLVDIDRLHRINPEQIRTLDIDALTRPLNEQPYQVGLKGIPAIRWPDQSQYNLNRSMTEPMPSQIEELFSTTDSEILASGVGSYYPSASHAAFPIPRAKTVINPSSQKDSVIGDRQLQRSISNHTGSQRSRGPGSTGTARRRSMGPPPPCSVCNKILKNQSDVTKHAKSHTKPYKCSDVTCAKHVEGFSTPNDCDRHERSKHHKRTNDGKDRGYVCSVCAVQPTTRHEKWWPRLDNFKSHITKKHQGYNVEDVIRASQRDQRPDDDTISMAPSNCFTTSHADTDVQYQYESIGMPPPAGILNSSQQGEMLSWTAEPFAESHDLAGVGQVQSADYAAYDRKHNPVSYGCDQTDKHAVYLRPNILQPVVQIIKDDEEMKTAEAISPDTTTKTEDLTTDQESYSSNLDESEDCTSRKFAAKLYEENSKHVNQLRCTHKRCNSTFRRECDRRKHEQRHIRPYGCTWPKCYERHGSKSDWIRHESKIHMLADRWLCTHTVNDSGEQCRTCFWKAEELQKHILTNHIASHPEAEELISEERIASMLLGRRGQQRFWCGFCCEVIDNHVQSQGKDPWTARCDHIGTHIDRKGGKHIKDWICLEFMKSKASLMSDLRRTGQHPDPHGHDKDLPMPLREEEWKRTLLDVDDVHSAMHTASYAKVRSGNPKPEPM